MRRGTILQYTDRKNIGAGNKLLDFRCIAGCWWFWHVNLFLKVILHYTPPPPPPTIFQLQKRKIVQKLSTFNRDYMVGLSGSVDKKQIIFECSVVRKACSIMVIGIFPY